MQANSTAVSLVIVTFDGSELTLDCVNSIVENTRNYVYEVIVVDNGSSEDEVAKLVHASHGHFKLISLNRNLFFGEANNIAVEYASGDYIVFLNNDVRVTSGWLDRLMMTLDREPFAGAVGPKFLHPDGTLQEAGAYIRPDGWTLRLSRTNMLFPPSYANTNQVVDYCSAACLLMKKNAFLRLGGFDPLFEPAYFEDADLALRLRSIGLFTYFCGQAVVYHEENTTSRRLWSNEQMDGYIAANHDRFLRRWGNYLQHRLKQDCEPEPLPDLVWKPETYPNERKTVVLFCSNPLAAAEESRRLLLVASALQDSHNIVIAADEVFSRCRVYSLCREFGIELTSFRVRNISTIGQPDYDLVILFDEHPTTSRIVGSHLAFGSEGRILLDFIEDASATASNIEFSNCDD